MEGVVEEHQQGEGASASETLENVGRVKGHDIQSGPTHYFMKQKDEKKNDRGGATEEQVSISSKGG